MVSGLRRRVDTGVKGLVANDVSCYFQPVVFCGITELQNSISRSALFVFCFNIQPPELHRSCRVADFEAVPGITISQPRQGKTDNIFQFCPSEIQALSTLTFSGCKELERLEQLHLKKSALVDSSTRLLQRHCQATLALPSESSPGPSVTAHFQAGSWIVTATFSGRHSAETLRYCFYRQLFG